MKNKVIVLIGRAPCWDFDFSRFCQFNIPFDIGAIGLDCPYEGDIEYFFTYHPNDIKQYNEKRKQKGLSLNYTIVSHVFDKDNIVSQTEPWESPSGSSAMLGTLFSMRIGYEKIVLCGCPLEGNNDKGFSYKPFRKGWMTRKDKVVNKVRSMSGWTAEFLGKPEKDWFL